MSKNEVRIIPVLRDVLFDHLATRLCGAKWREAWIRDLVLSLHCLWDRVTFLSAPHPFPFSPGHSAHLPLENSMWFCLGCHSHWPALQVTVMGVCPANQLCIALLGYSLGMSTWSKLSQSQCFLKMNMDARREKLLFLGGINSLDRGKPFRCCGPESSICWGRERGDREGATKGPAVWPPGSPAFQSWFSLAGPRKQILISSWRRSAALPPKVQKDEKVGRLNFLAILGPPTSSKSPRPLTLSGTQVTTPQSTESRSVQ